MLQLKKLMRGGAAAMLVGAVAGCGSSLSDMGTMRPRTGSWFGSALTFGDAGNFTPLPPAGAEDLVGPDGRCALPEGVAAASAQATDGNANPAAPSAMPSAQGSPVGAGIALQMTECEVVSRAGPVEKVDVGVNERSERAVTLTYLNGPWPGIYRFTDGRLTQIDRVAEPEAPKAKRKAPAKKRA